MNPQVVSFLPSSALAARLAMLAADVPLALHSLGNPNLLHHVLGLFCSSKAPGGIFLHVHDLAQRWRVEGPMVISGFHSPVEQEALAVLLRGPQPVIICPARSLVGIHIKPEYVKPLEEERLLLLSAFPVSVRRVTAETAHRRNRFVAMLADQVLIAHAHPGSKTAQLAQELTERGRPVFTLDHPANEHLLTMGLQVWRS